MRREGPAPLGEPRISPSQILPLNAQDCESVRVRRAASLGVESQTPPPLPRSGGERAPSAPCVFPTPALAPLPLTLRQHNSPGSAQAQATQKPGGGVSSGCLATAPSSLTQSCCREHWGLAVFWNGGGKHTGTSRRFHTILSFSSLSYLPAQSGGL